MSLAETIAEARETIAGACARAHRPESSVRLLAATKTVSADRIREAHGLGVRLFGENRVQEREQKSAALADLDAEWHLLGSLQSNKAGRALGLFGCIGTVDSLLLAQRLSRLIGMQERPILQVFLEVNIGNEPQKHGVAPLAAIELALQVAQLPGLELRGLMAVPPAAETAERTRPYFARLAELGDRVRLGLGRGAEGWELSMGMSHDYAVAIEEGATIIRLGTALFGKRGGA